MMAHEPSGILVKLPVKLGDTIMAAYFLRAVKELYPTCRLDVIIAKGLTDLLAFMPYVDGHYEFSKKEYPGPVGNYRFGRFIASQNKYDLFFCLPFSFSSALAGFFTKSRIRIGYRREHRGFLFTKAVKRPPGLHIVEEFMYLLSQFSGSETPFRPLGWDPPKPDSFSMPSENSIILNIKSGPPSRSIPVIKAIDVADVLLKKYPYDIILTGASSEVEYISQVKQAFPAEKRVINLAGKTSLSELFFVISEAKGMITTDSGNAHVANAVGTPAVVLFGAAHEHRAKPYDQSISKVLKYDDLECVPCESEHCKFGDNRCLTSIENTRILNALDAIIKR